MVVVRRPNGCGLAQVFLDNTEVMFVHHAVTVDVTGQRFQTEGLFCHLEVVNRQGSNRTAGHQFGLGLKNQYVVPCCTKGPIGVGMQADRECRRVQCLVRGQIECGQAKGIVFPQTEIAGTLDGLKIDGHGVVVEGRTARAIADVAEDLCASLIVVASHGHTRLERIALGSSAEAIVRAAPCSVLVQKLAPE